MSKITFYIKFHIYFHNLTKPFLKRHFGIKMGILLLKIPFLVLKCPYFGDIMPINGPKTQGNKKFDIFFSFKTNLRNIKLKGSHLQGPKFK